MKIVILGSHGTGKTTLARILHKYLEENIKINYELSITNYELKINKNSIKKGQLKWTYLPEAPFEAYRKGFTMNEETSLESEWWIVAKQLEMELLTPEPWIADKCLIDILAYALYLFPQEKDFLKVVKELIKKNIKNINYDLVIYLPCGEFPIPNDGLRSLDVHFQVEIDKLIVSLMKELEINFFTLRGSCEQRFEEAKNLIKLIDKFI